MSSDIFDSVSFAATSTRPSDAAAGGIETERLAIVQPDAEVVEQRFALLNERRANAARAAVARRNAATARQVAQSFGEYGRAFRKVAATKGSPIDHAVCLFLAATCEQQSDHYSELQDDSTKTADRYGSI